MEEVIKIEHFNLENYIYSSIHKIIFIFGKQYIHIIRYVYSKFV